jgi:hypothetical protein
MERQPPHTLPVLQAQRTVTGQQQQQHNHRHQLAAMPYINILRRDLVHLHQCHHCSFTRQLAIKLIQAERLKAQPSPHSQGGRCCG